MLTKTRSHLHIKVIHADDAIDSIRSSQETHSVNHVGEDVQLRHIKLLGDGVLGPRFSSRLLSAKKQNSNSELMALLDESSPLKLAGQAKKGKRLLHSRGFEAAHPIPAGYKKSPDASHAGAFLI